MAQPPFKADILQIDPGSGDTLTIDRDAADGAMRFIDAVLTSGVLLPDLVGLRNITGLFIVGTGDGAPYTAIQDALDDVPDTSSSTSPSLVLVTPGVYSENLTISKDGVFIIGIGGVTITNSSADATVKVTQADSAIVPKSVRLQNLVIENTDNAEECVVIDGSNTFATGTITVDTAPMTAGDTITIGGVVLTGVAGTRTSGSDDFDASLGTVGALAVEIAAAINDTSNSFVGTLVEASESSGVVTLTAITPGSTGNSITLTTTSGDVTLSGATLTGGGGVDSEVGLEGISLIDCDLIASGIGTFQMRVDIANHVRVEGGTWGGGSSSSKSDISQSASFKLFGVHEIKDLEFSYDDSADQPSVTTSEYSVSNCRSVGDVLSNLVGIGSLQVSHCSVVGDVSQGGDRTLGVLFCEIGDLAVDGTTVANLLNTSRGSASGTGTLEETSLTGSVAFVASLSESVVFDVSQPDTSYTVLVESPTTTAMLAVTSKTTSGFTISSSAVITATVSYVVQRQV